VEQRQAYASDLLNSERLRELSSADRALTTELVMGVLRWRSRLDSAISAVASQKPEKLDPEVLLALRLATYQLGFLERIPPRAAVNESVELVKRARKRSAMPFVNAVLRRVVDGRELIRPIAESEGEAPAAISEAAAQLSQLYAHPTWLVARWVREFGPAAAEQICAYDQQPPETALRLRDATVEEELRAAGIALAPGALLTSARRLPEDAESSVGDLVRTVAWQQGRVYIQDEASQLVAALLGDGTRLLDCCAAPGGKTAVLADRNPGASILAADLHPHRARLLRQLVRAANVHVVAADALHLPTTAQFDRVLADVPCSATGTLARNPEIKWRLQAADLTDLHQRQLAILLAAMERVASGGRLLYSTCSLEREEDEAVVDEALALKDGFRLLQCRQELLRLQRDGELAWGDIDSSVSGPYLRTVPGVHPCDGFFAAVMERA
jgi:16S rRNA (cytosine967-C5)-methyltransferase